MGSNHKKRVFFTVITLIMGLLLLISLGWAGNYENEASERDEVKRVIDNMERAYERESVTQFMGFISRRKFPNLIAFRRAVENDFNLNRQIRLRRTSERLTLSKGMAIHQATWQKQYMPMMISPHGGSRMRRVSGTVRIYLEKEKSGWKVINIQGYPIFGV